MNIRPDNTEGSEFEREELYVSDSEDSLRLDKFLSARLSIGRDRLKELIISNKVFVGGRNISKPSFKLSSGDVVVIFLPIEPSFELIPQNIPLNIIYEDDHLIVINKPSGMVVHPGAGNPDSTLLNALLYHCPSLRSLGGIRPGLVHRLDKDTSGVIVAAKTDKAFYALQTQFKNREIKKRYFAVVYGSPEGEKGKIVKPIGRDRRSRTKVSSKTDSPREAVTEWAVAERMGPFCSLDVFPMTGRTHQIRVHLSESGFPIVGDVIYAANIVYPEPYRVVISRFGRLALHAASLLITHPVTGKIMEFKAPLPEEFSELLSGLSDIAGGKEDV